MWYVSIAFRLLQTINDSEQLYMKIAMKGTKLSEFGNVFYNNFLSIPLVIALVLWDGLEGITE